jgi:glycosyltransferase involved in cell wall biosynthesis
MRPDASVVIPAFRARHQIDGALNSLARQTYAGPVEIVVVASGHDACAAHVRANHPGVSVVDVSRRLWPGEARNIGIQVASGGVVAFMPADTEASAEWLEQRMVRHQNGVDLVGGSIVDGLPRHPVGHAEYLIEYSALMPIKALLEEQSIPHALSFRREVFDLVGGYPEHTATGEDTLFNKRCIDAGFKVTYAPDAGLIHWGNRSLWAMWRHAYRHGRGLAQCVSSSELKAAIGSMSQPALPALWRMLVVYPLIGFHAKFRRLARFAPIRLVGLFMLAPIVLSGLIATGLGAWRQYRGLRAQ